MRRAMIILLSILIVLALAFLLGPRVPADTRLTFDPASVGADPVAYLAASEAKTANIRPGQQKQIVWASPARGKTPLAIVYVHGFSASSGEVRPLPDKVAGALGANLFFTRLTGHGQNGAAMADGSVNAWINDYAEAISIGRMIGDKVVVIATSTGASLAVAEAADHQRSADIAALILISPNFGIQAGGSFLLTMPWGKQLAGLIVGPERSFPARNEKQAALWTTSYPTVALLPMAKLVDLAYKTRVESIQIPSLFVFSDHDKVVRPDLTHEIVSRWGGPHEMVVVEKTDDTDSHVIAGDSLSPSTTDDLANKIVDWLRSSKIAA